MKAKQPFALLLFLAGGAAFGPGCGQIDVNTREPGAASASAEAGATTNGGEGGAASSVESGGAAGTVARSGATAMVASGGAAGTTEVDEALGGAGGESFASASDRNGGTCGPPDVAWAGCYVDQPCFVCADTIAAFPLYLRRHPHCESYYACAHGRQSPCSADCPPPSDADQCDGTPGNWEGCRGLGCYVCSELVADYPKYFVHHPFCISNATCDGQYFTCSAACPPPADKDR